MCKNPIKNTKTFPIKNLDFPNDINKPDYVLYGYPFNNKKKIVIGPSDLNTKKINLDEIYPHNTKLSIISEYNDNFSYEFHDKELIIKRTDQNLGWGQNLIGYV